MAKREVEGQAAGSRRGLRLGAPPLPNDHGAYAMLLMPLLRVADADDAVRRANESPFGLGAALWTADLARARRLARAIEAGSVFINGMVASDPRLPFGGVKHSGYGRERSVFGIREFVNIQTVWIGPAGGGPTPGGPLRVGRHPAQRDAIDESAYGPIFPE